MKTKFNNVNYYAALKLCKGRLPVSNRIANGRSLKLLWFSTPQLNAQLAELADNVILTRGRGNGIRFHFHNQ